MTPEEFRRRMAELPSPNAPPPDGTWDRHRYELHQHAESDDPEKFLRWSTVEGTMVIGDVPYIHQEIARLREKYPNWQALIAAPGCGGEQTLQGNISPTIAHQAYHFLVFESAGGRRVSEMSTICEIGGGFGAMATAARRMGFGGDYYIYDLPEFSLLQEYYLDCAGVRATQITDANDIPENSDLLIGMWSVGEIPIPERDILISERKAANYLFAYMPDFCGVNNHDWFGKFAAARFREQTWRYFLAACSSVYIVGTQR